MVVLAGLVAGHGLGPAPAPAAAHAAATSHHASAADHGQAIPDGAACQEECVHADDPADNGGGGRAEHADATCAAIGTAAATGTAGAPVLPAPAVLPDHAEAQTVLAHGVIPDATACGRAPPSLSEMQPLRI
ncbi:DUF6153 family protein [Streptomyces sp. Wb2n-11]|uniref:DUF6153 family protein n=1 Tax=Streptomyces sp. Wb2n-11 TaxID=1030533 RepID=UPI000B837B74|nr:DUF6153 family protein [Streptomyces sp. Wb2n-11]